jgi:hypothetical protein
VFFKARSGYWTSDLESKFNVKVASDLAQCDPSRKKYERSILSSDMTCRRIMQRVFNEAQNIGFASFPSEQKGTVWCWGDEAGRFTNGVDHYIYETYYKLHSTVATRDSPCCVCVCDRGRGAGQFSGQRHHYVWCEAS